MTQLLDLTYNYSTSWFTYFTHFLLTHHLTVFCGDTWHQSEMSLVISGKQMFHCNHNCDQEDLLPLSPVGKWRRLGLMHQEPGCLPGVHQTAFQPAKRTCALWQHGCMHTFKSNIHVTHLRKILGTGLITISNHYQILIPCHAVSLSPAPKCICSYPIQYRWKQSVFSPKTLMKFQGGCNSFETCNVQWKDYLLCLQSTSQQAVIAQTL